MSNTHIEHDLDRVDDMIEVDLDYLKDRFGVDDEFEFEPMRRSGPERGKPKWADHKEEDKRLRELRKSTRVL